jgi:5'-nucleotidase
MHILFVNDDGISAVGITALVKEAAARGHRVTVAAPAQQQSAASHRITFAEPIMMRPYDTGIPGVEAFAIRGTPADCVRVALLGGLVTDPVDVVVSGINKGLNAGIDVHYSGTVGAAMEASMLGLRAIASSIGWGADETSLAALAALTIDWAEKYSRIEPLPVSVLNINAPGGPVAAWKPAVYAPLDVTCRTDRYERRESPFSGSYFWLLSDAEPEGAEGTDCRCLTDGHVTLTMVGNFGCLNAEGFHALGL